MGDYKRVAALHFERIRKPGLSFGKEELAAGFPVPRETFWEVCPDWESFHVEQDWL